MLKPIRPAVLLGLLGLLLIVSSIARADGWDNGQLDDNPLPLTERPHVWTGTEAIFFTGKGGGQRFDPVTQTWRRLDDRPGRGQPEIAIWVGDSVFLMERDRGVFERFYPDTNSYVPLSPIGAPASGYPVEATWNGTEVFVYGAAFTSERGAYRYNLATDSWFLTASAGAPRALGGHAIVWIGESYIVWDGSSDPARGAEYFPNGNWWRLLTSLNQPPARTQPVAGWNGEKLVIWSSRAQFTDFYVRKSGGLYDPVTREWETMTESEDSAYGFWAGDAAFTNYGYFFRPEPNRWFSTSELALPNLVSPRAHGLWLGQKALFWGGILPFSEPQNSGAIYDAVTDSWTQTSQDNGVPDSASHLLWTGDKVLVGTEALYDPILDAFEPISQQGVPLPGPMVWTGSEAIVYSGLESSPGARYSPTLDQWTPLSSVNAPTDRTGAAIAWNGGQMLVVGGEGEAGTTAKLYIAGSDTWITLADVPDILLINGFRDPQAWWTGSQFLVWDRDARKSLTFSVSTNTWNGNALRTLDSPTVDVDAIWVDGKLFKEGTPSAQLYDPVADSWSTATPVGNFPLPTQLATDGQFVYATTDTAQSTYDPLLDSWTPTDDLNHMGRRSVWTDRFFFHWGGPTLDPNSICDGCDVGVGGRFFPNDDDDGDGLGLSSDNCPVVANVDQIDSDGDGIGDDCDRCPADPRNDEDRDGLCSDVDPCPRSASDDSDLDGVCDNLDTCPDDGAAPQTDGDGDGYGDDCDPYPFDADNDLDRDGFAADLDNCPLHANFSQLDADADGAGDICDNCFFSPNPSQSDADLDEFGNACDNCAFDFNPLQEDADADGFGDVCDLCQGIPGSSLYDIDQDGFGDQCDICPYAVDALQIDSDGDGAGDACDCSPFDGGSRTPSEVLSVMADLSATVVQFHWAPADGAETYGGTRIAISELAEDDYGACLTTSLASPLYEDADLPGPGEGFAYLFVGVESVCGQGTLGATGAPAERQNANPAACP